MQHRILISIRLFLMIFWLYVALDKLWNLQGFHLSLLKQPFPHWGADVLFWLLPTIELGTALLMLRRSQTLSYLSSTLLMFAFTVYIGLGIAGLYAKRPCSCASIFHGMSWEHHLIVNIGLLGISIYGYYLSRKGDNNGHRHQKMKLSSSLRSASHRRRNLINHDDAFLSIIIVFVAFCKWFCHTFALFPGRPVYLDLNYTFCRVFVKRYDRDLRSAIPLEIGSPFICKK